MSSNSNNNFPVLPRINVAELVLEVFTHKSLRNGHSSNGQSSDNQRLAELGDKVLVLAVTNSLYKKTPIVKAADIPIERDKILSEENIAKWVNHYHLSKQLLYAPDLHDTINSPEELRTLLNAYIGAVFTQSGMGAITTWIGHLIGADTVAPSPTTDDEMDEHEPGQTPKRAKNEPSSPSVPLPPPPTPPAASALPPIILGYQQAQPTYPQPSYSQPVASTGNTVTYLPLFNQTCMQRKLNVEYNAEFSGPPHAGRWNIKCVVNGAIKGVGQGVSKQIAKEEAAKQAFFAMGFGPYSG
ncbi:hypothetical protein BD410DRAFT_782169 [Rickenella mellea]|uniref:Uncharacterized protein n=1 Tax=Rickenella mellea TaxID=50990 RepID=A0A4Y7QMQ8_9AGAM|nr:hypothetical protein BD410DRAFT_782169 [Rickenella mellea]